MGGGGEPSKGSVGGGVSNGHARLHPQHNSSDSPSSSMDPNKDPLFEAQLDPTKMPPAIEAVLRGSWPFENPLWHSSPASMGVSYKNGTQVR